MASLLTAEFAEKRVPGTLLRHGPQILFAILGLVIFSMDSFQIVLASAGAAMYIISNVPMRQRRKPAPAGKLKLKPAPPARAPAQPRGRTSEQAASKRCSPGKDRQTVVRPLSLLSFASLDFDGQVQELLQRITPTTRTERVVAQLARHVKRQLIGITSEMEVLAFAGSELMRGTAFGVAIPEVHLVVCMTSRSVDQYLLGRWKQPLKETAEANMIKIQKKAVRVFTEHLVRNGAFKFRRSSFQAGEPKVTLSALADLGVHSEPIPFDLTFNSRSPLYNAAFLSEAGKLDHRAKSLALLVKRWAKDRAMCQASKGHLSPYVWTLLVIFFLQVGLPGGPWLPPLSEFETFRSMVPQHQQGRISDARVHEPTPKESLLKRADTKPLSVGELFRRFIKFFGGEFDFLKEAVCVLHGRRAAPGEQLPLNIIVRDDGSSTVGPSVQDPCSTKCNLAMGMNEAAWQHFQAEFARATALLEAGAGLPELLEPWSCFGAVDDHPDGGFNVG